MGHLASAWDNYIKGFGLAPASRLLPISFKQRIFMLLMAHLLVFFVLLSAFVFCFNIENNPSRAGPAQGLIFTTYLLPGNVSVDDLLLRLKTYIVLNAKAFWSQSEQVMVTRSQLFDAFTRSNQALVASHKLRDIHRLRNGRYRRSRGVRPARIASLTQLNSLSSQFVSGNIKPAQETDDIVEFVFLGMTQRHKDRNNPDEDPLS